LAAKKPTLIFASFLLLLGLCGAVFAATAFRLWRTWQSYEAAYYARAVPSRPSVSGEASAGAVPPPEDEPAILEIAAQEQEREQAQKQETVSEDTDLEDTAPIAINFDELLAVNRDVVGWLYCPGTSINFPILQTQDRESFPGCLFVDGQVGPLLQTPNTVIYGPSIADGGMLDELRGYTSQDFYEEHPEIWLLTPEGNYRIHLLGGREIPVGAPFFTPDNRAEAEDEMLRVMERSTFIAPAQLEGQLVTISTSAEESSPSRFVVFGLTK